MKECAYIQNQNALHTKVSFSLLQPVFLVSRLHWHNIGICTHCIILLPIKRSIHIGVEGEKEDVDLG